MGWVLIKDKYIFKILIATLLSFTCGGFSKVYALKISSCENLLLKINQQSPYKNIVGFPLKRQLKEIISERDSFYEDLNSRLFLYGLRLTQNNTEIKAINSRQGKITKIQQLILELKQNFDLKIKFSLDYLNIDQDKTFTIDEHLTELEFNSKYLESPKLFYKHLTQVKQMFTNKTNLGFYIDFNSKIITGSWSHKVGKKIHEIYTRHQGELIFKVEYFTKGSPQIAAFFSKKVTNDLDTIYLSHGYTNKATSEELAVIIDHEYYHYITEKNKKVRNSEKAIRIISLDGSLPVTNYEYFYQFDELETSFNDMQSYIKLQKHRDFINTYARFQNFLSNQIHFVAKINKNISNSTLRYKLDFVKNEIIINLSGGINVLIPFNNTFERSINSIPLKSNKAHVMTIRYIKSLMLSREKDLSIFETKIVE